MDYSKLKHTGVELIQAERSRQLDKEGWGYDHDNEHTNHELARAAVAYTLASFMKYHGVSRYWPWDRIWWKPASPIRMLVKAGALIAAEIERRIRAGERE